MLAKGTRSAASSQRVRRTMDFWESAVATERTQACVVGLSSSIWGATLTSTRAPHRALEKDRALAKDRRAMRHPAQGHPTKETMTMSASSLAAEHPHRARHPRQAHFEKGWP